MDTYDSSDSEEDYTEKEKQLLKRVSEKEDNDSDSEDEVFGVASASEEEDDKDDMALSDIEGQEDKDYMPDHRAWGKDKRGYYGADYVDPDFDGFQGKDAHFAEIEEEEARNLQSQLIQQLDDADFSLDIFLKKTVGDKDKIETEEIIKTDISSLTKKQKLQILQKESPEFFGLIDDFEVKMIIAKDYLHPVLQKYSKGQITTCLATEFVETYYQIIFNYLANIYMYLILRLNKNLQNHPVVKRLFQYRQLLSQLDPIYENIVKPQIDIILGEEDGMSDPTNIQKKKKSTLKLLRNLKKSETIKEKKGITISESDKMDKNIEPSYEENDTGDMSTNEPSSQINGTEDIKMKEDELEKRAITYKMAKNKGLTPHRKKEQRNPRVKHKLKFRKAIIRRRGAVREPRRELSRYSGEISGIKTTVSKSIKIKT